MPNSTDSRRIDGDGRWRGQASWRIQRQSAHAHGEIEVDARSVAVQGTAELLPFQLIGEENTPENLRLTYRFLDLRRQKLHENILLRSRVIASIRRRMTELGFNEFQTPILTSSSPEGARDYLVPSRLYPGQFYALPQAPQQFKQLLMVSGFDRYFQIAPCFRDEDARADRSPGEFYQLDVEMSFVTQEDVFTTIEGVMHGLFAEFANGWHVTPTPFPRIPFAEAMLKYGSDKPDLRFALPIQDVTAHFASSEFKAFRGIVENGGVVRALVVPGLAEKSRKFFDDLETFAKETGAKGLATLALSGRRRGQGNPGQTVARRGKRGPENCSRRRTGGRHPVRRRSTGPRGDRARQSSSALGRPVEPPSPQFL
jgi:aspartyl-tRNA synthetase